MEKLIIKVGSNHTIEEIVSSLSDFGYEKVLTIDLSPGQFSVSGGNLRIYPVESPGQCVLEFFGDEIDRILVKNSSEKIGLLEVSPNRLLLNDGTRISQGDYIVHEDHGIGQFKCLGIRNVNGQDIEYIFINYLNNDVLYLPYNLRDKISLYIGVGRKKPRLSRLGSQSWIKTYKKTYENIKLVARELLEIYANREIAKKDPWIINAEWDRIIRQGFPHEETADQEKAIRDIFSDYKKEVPMDRLVCGDVGLGKTEVAIRAITQAIANNSQVAMVVPTTVLAEQHFVTIKKRFKDLPVEISHISRLVGNSDQKQILCGLEKGSIDLIIGTHRLLENDIKFKNLGLVIIDEEQKFGVKDKERLKKIRDNVSVLMITATPIPRTLFMALSGLRDVSQINSIPTGRMAIETRVDKYNEEEVINAIKFELDRHGQIYYLHNEVRTIQGIKRRLEKFFPESNIGIAHGQLPEKELGRIMGQFANGEIDILICSTIMENGLDLPNANTLIVEDSHNFGLSQLHQIRGRIGRSQTKAHAFFTYPEKKLTENAIKRLKSLAENSDLGAGYNIALSDLEIRGGGNILGKEQHGNMEAIGIVLYSKLLKLAVEKIRSGKKLSSALL